MKKHSFVLVALLLLYSGGKGTAPAHALDVLVGAEFDSGRLFDIFDDGYPMR